MKRILILLILVFSVEAFALKPDLKYLRKPDELNITYQEYLVTTPDNYKIKTWVCTPEKTIDKKVTIILAYGDAGNMSYWLNQVAELLKKGFTVVTFDYRGFGESDSFSINPEYLYYNDFVIDLVSIIRWTKNNNNENQIGVWALSMGTIMTTLAMQQEKVDFIIAEGFVICPLKIKESIKKLKNKEIILPPDWNNYDNALNNLSTRTLLFSGKQDIVTTIEDSKYVKNLNSQNKIIEFEGNHLQGFQVLTSESFGDGYIKEINGFIN